MFDVLIKNAKIVSSQEIIEGNLYIRDEKIAAVSRDLLDEGAAKVIDAAGKYAMPGVVDEHVHIIDMGQPELGKYELDSGGAAVGGITTVLEMPLSMPPSTTLENFKKKEERAGSAFMVDYGLYGGAVPGNLEEMYKINDAGCIGFKAMMAGSVPDMFDVADDGSLLEIFRAIKEMGSTIRRPRRERRADPYRGAAPEGPGPERHHRVSGFPLRVPGERGRPQSHLPQQRPRMLPDHRPRQQPRRGGHHQPGQGRRPQRPL